MADNNNTLCEVCMADESGLRRWVDIYGNVWCLNCVRLVLEPVINQNDESAWPPRLLDRRFERLDDFPELVDILPEEFVQRYRDAERMYREAALINRIFCPFRRFFGGRTEDERCNQYIGRRRPMRDDGRHQWEACTRCQREETCLACGCGRDGAAQQDGDGACQVTDEVWDWEVGHASEERGRNFQYCPVRFLCVWCLSETCANGTCYIIELRQNIKFGGGLQRDDVSLRPRFLLHLRNGGSI